MWKEIQTEKDGLRKYEYKSVWKESFIDSTFFRVLGYINTKPPYASKRMISQVTTIGIFRIDIASLANIMSIESLKKNGQSVVICSAESENQPVIGDTKTTYKVLSFF